MEPFARDRPGLLAIIGKVLLIFTSLHGARITTIGERVEDFVLTDSENKALNQK